MSAKPEIQPAEFFREATLRICGSLDIDQALERTFEYVKQHIPADTMGLGFSELNSGRISVLTSVADPDARFIWKDGGPEIRLSPEQVAFIHSQSPDRPMVRIVNRPEDQDEPLRALFPELKSNSAIFMRLDIRGEEIGALLISVAERDRYTPEHARLIESVRGPFTIAMLNGRRYRELVESGRLLAEEHKALKADLNRASSIEVVGADFGLREVLDQVRRIAPSSSPTLLLGETGTGKEVIANAIHTASQRSKEPMIVMQCGAIPETLLDSELFGHERGAFTGAMERKRGRFERANGGTLFLDEIGELSMSSQIKLLRVLQEKKFERIGGTSTLEVDVRVIAATHRDLESMVRAGTFREDLWYRLNVLPIRVPPLRLRRDDIPSLVQYFIKLKAREMNLMTTPFVSQGDLQRLRKYDWPGNVRELQNLVERALILSRDGKLVFPDLGQPETQTQPTVATHQGLHSLDHAMRLHIRYVLEQTKWKVAGSQGAAEVLGLNPSTLRFRMQKLGIQRNPPARS